MISRLLLLAALSYSSPAPDKRKTRLRGSRHTNPRYPTRPKDIHLENLEKKNLNKTTLSHSRQARHRCELARASTITGTPPEPPKRLR